MSTPADKKIKTWQRAGAVVLALSVWQAASWAVGSALLLPGPVTVLGRLCALAVTAAFRRAVAFSFCRIAGGFALALVLAFVLALAAGRWPVVEVLLRPYVLAIKAVPVALAACEANGSLMLRGTLPSAARCTTESTPSIAAVSASRSRMVWACLSSSFL